VSNIEKNPNFDGNPDDAEHIEWDDGNLREFEAHQISVEEVHDALSNPVTRVPNTNYGSNRWKVLGITNGGRKLTVIVEYDSRRRLLRPITGWDSSKGEVSKYF
jgi:uncharacterized DUF497 family protein